MSTHSHVHQTANECPACETYLPTLGHLLSEYHAFKASVAGRLPTEADWQTLFDIERRIRDKGGMHLIGTTYNED